jgi:hypothetical protein
VPNRREPLCIALAPHGRRSVSWLGLVIAIAIAAPSHAASLTLLTNAPAASPLVITPQGVALPLLVKIVNAAAVDLPSEFLSAWQLRLQLLPDAGAAGTLNFATAVEPEAYVFDGTGHFGPSISASGTGVFAADFNFPASGGVKAPPAPGTGLLSITFAPSAGALGRFGVYALAGLGTANGPTRRTRSNSAAHSPTFRTLADRCGSPTCW